jgi:hypothetical protein
MLEGASNCSESQPFRNDRVKFCTVIEAVLQSLEKNARLLLDSVRVGLSEDPLSGTETLWTEHIKLLMGT